jgi:hypothetical protein
MVLQQGCLPAVEGVIAIRCITHFKLLSGLAVSERSSAMMLLNLCKA